MYRIDFWTLWEKVRVGCFERTASKHVSYQGWNRSPAQVGCMRQVLMAGALGRPKGIVWRGRWEGGSGWGTHVNPWLIYVNVWQNPLKCCEVISLQLIKINEKKNNFHCQAESSESVCGHESPQVAGLLNKATFMFLPSLVSWAFERWAAKPEFRNRETRRWAGERLGYLVSQCWVSHSLIRTIFA